MVRYTAGVYDINRADYDIKKTPEEGRTFSVETGAWPQRLITNSLKDNQPVIRNDLFVIHNGIIINDDEIWTELGLNRQTSLDSEAIVGILGGISQKLAWSLFLDKFFLNARCCLSSYWTAKARQINLFSNNGSLYVGYRNGSVLFAVKNSTKKLACKCSANKMMTSCFLISRQKSP